MNAIVIGAGPAGMATSRELSVRGVDHVVLERGSIAQVWEDLYDGLVLHTGKHLSALPGMPFPASTPLFPLRRHFLDYLHRYAERFRLPVTTHTNVERVRRDGDEWVVSTAAGAHVRSRMLVAATGIVSNPQVPVIPDDEGFRGGICHSVASRRPGEFAGRRVLVVGAGNSAGEIAVELAGAGAQVTVAVRSGARVVPRELFGLPLQYFAVALAGLPRPAQRVVEDVVAGVSARLRGPAVLPRPTRLGCSNVPLIGFHLVDGIRSGAIRLKGTVVGLTAQGARFADGSDEPFDQIILATGYRAALGVFGGLIGTDACGFGARRDRVSSAGPAWSLLRRAQLRHPRCAAEHRPGRAPGGGLHRSSVDLKPSPRKQERRDERVKNNRDCPAQPALIGMAAHANDVAQDHPGEVHAGEENRETAAVRVGLEEEAGSAREVARD